MADLEEQINRATNPNNVYEDWKAIVTLCDQLSKDGSSIPNAVRLLSHKMQSPQEKEALYALRTLEACVQRCGTKFHTEIGKFRFLNEMIKMLSPKYLGSKTSETVKRRVTEILRTWNTQLKSESKIADAYAMLQRNGFIKEQSAGDQPQQSVDAAKSGESAKKKVPSIFEDDEKSKTLAALLKSTNPADLVAANKLIKTMLKEDAELQDRLIKRDVELETVANNVKLLTEMLNSLEVAVGGPNGSEVEIVRELEATLQRARPQLVKLAAETDERDSDTVALICKLGDDVTTALARYADAMGPRLLDDLPQPAVTMAGNETSALSLSLSAAGNETQASAQAGPDVCLLDLDFGFGPPPVTNVLVSTPATVTMVTTVDQNRPSDTNALLSDIFSGQMVTNTPTPAVLPAGFVPPPRTGNYTSLTALKSGTSLPPGNTVAKPVDSPPKQTSTSSPFAELEFLQKSSLVKSQPTVTNTNSTTLEADELLMNVQEQSNVVVTEATYTDFVKKTHACTAPCGTLELLPPLEIQVNEVLPSTAVSKCLFECEKVRAMLHFTENRPQPVGSRLLVVALSSYNASKVQKVDLDCCTFVKLERCQLANVQNGVVNLNGNLTSKCLFQCAAFRVLAMSSSAELAPFNPLVPPSTVTFALHLASASESRCSVCQREPQTLARCVKLRVSFVVNGARFEQLVNLADFF